MKFNIPPIGYKLTVAAPWTVDIHTEYRNGTMMSWLTTIDPSIAQNWMYNDVNTVTIPAGLNLTVDRIYIRKGSSDFDSISFNVRGIKGFGLVRFWVKLDQLQTLEYEPG